MKKVLIATEKPFAKEAVDGIKKIADEAGYEIVLLEKYTEKSQLLEAVANVDAMIIRSDIADKEVLDAAKNLKVVVRAGAGYDNIDLAAATANNIVAMNGLIAICKPQKGLNFIGLLAWAITRCSGSVPCDARCST